MSIYKSSVQRPITTMMIFAALIVFGLYSLTRLPVDLYPELEFPAITVMTLYPGANAGDIETSITNPIEGTLNTLDNLKEITSVSQDNMSIVTLEFEWESNLDEAANDIRNALEFITQTLPEEAENPVIYKFNSALMPIMFYAVTANESYEGIQKILEERIINPLNRIDGVGNIGLSGLPQRVVYVEVDPVKMEAYNINIEMIGGIIQAENLNFPAGNIKMGLMDYQFKVEGEFSGSHEIDDLVIGSFMGQSIRISDVACVRDTIRDMSIIENINRETGIRMFVQKQSGANTVDIARRVSEELKNLEKNLPSDVRIETIFDSSDFINDSINNLTRTLMYALIFVILVVLFFLGRWRATFIVVLTIPISLIVAFTYLGIAGSSINIISLTSLAIAIGMVVDDAIVVLENITKHLERGSSPREAAIYATNEVWLAVIVTTLVIVAVFFPLTLVSGLTGVLFAQLGWIVTITVTTSTLAAISLTPMLSSKLLKARTEKSKNYKLSYNNTIKKLLDRLDSFYERVIRKVLRFKFIAIIVSVLIFVGTIMLLPGIGTEFIPETDQSQVRATIELQTGIRVEEAARVASEIEDIVYERYPEAILVSTSAGSDDTGGVSAIWGQSGSNIINLQIRLTEVSNRERSCWDIGEDLRTQLDRFSEISDYQVRFSGGMGGFGGDNTVDVEIYGYDFTTTNLLASEIASRIESLEAARDVQISRDQMKPELKVELDREKLAQFQLNTAGVSMQLRNRVSGLTASRYREDGEEYDIIVRFREEYRNTISDIENILITNQEGEGVRLREIGQVVETWEPPNIDHKRRERIVTVTTMPHGVSLGELASQIEDIVKDVDIPPGILVQLAGSYQEQQESFADLGLLLLLSIVLVYIVMASQFESFKIPLVIMFSIPFSFSGVILALYVTGTNLSVISALGAVLLVGIVVKNAIVLVDFINLMRDRGIKLNDAIAMSGKSRLRPVLMTAATTTLGMLPLALSRGEGSEIWSPMGISVIGGLAFSTILTLVIVPVMYAIFAGEGDREKRKKLYQKQFKFMDE